MSWTDRYWELLDRLYWSPQYLGLKSIPQKQWTLEGDTVSIPKAMTNKNGPLYRRIRSGDDYWTYVRRQEEVFNYLFDLTLAALPGDAIARILHPITNAGPQLEYEMLGANLRARYGANGNTNITTPDGFFVSPKSIVAMELKFDAKATRDQLAKYLMLFCAEEALTGQREQLDLVFVFNRDPDGSFRKQLGFSRHDCRTLPLERLTEAVHNGYVRSYFQNNPERAQATLARLQIHCIHWSDLAASLADFSMAIGSAENVGDRTLKRLLDGLVTEIKRHPLSNMARDDAR